MLIFVLVIQQWIQEGKSSLTRSSVVTPLRYRFSCSSQDSVELFRFSEVELRYIVHVILMDDPGELLQQEETSSVSSRVCVFSRADYVTQADGGTWLICLVTQLRG